MIGVITPLYNAADKISNAIASVQGQYIDCIHYIYDDASTDDSAGVVDRCIDKNRHHKIILIKGERRCGQSNARNALIDEAIDMGCTHIAFLDADDWWDPFHLSTGLDNMNTCDISYSIPKLTNGVQEVFPFGMTVPRIFIGKQLELNNFIWISGVVANAKCFKTFRFNGSLNSIEDWDMWYRQYKAGSIFKCTGKKTFTYLVTPGGEASKSDDKLELMKAINIFTMKSLKLNLACGGDYKDGYINCDLYPHKDNKIDAVFDARKIPYEDGTVDEIVASHIIEHFDFKEGQDVLKEWCRVLKPGGRLIIETPDFLEACRAFVNGNEASRVALYGHFFSMPWIDGLVHKFLFTETQLWSNLMWAGFKNIKRIPPFSKYVTKETSSLFLAMEALK